MSIHTEIYIHVKRHSTQTGEGCGINGIQRSHHLLYNRLTNYVMMQKYLPTLIAINSSHMAITKIEIATIQYSFPYFYPLFEEYNTGVTNEAENRVLLSQCNGDPDNQPKS